MDDDGADRHVVVLERPLGLAQGEAHEVLVAREEASTHWGLTIAGKLQRADDVFNQDGTEPPRMRLPILLSLAAVAAAIAPAGAAAQETPAHVPGEVVVQYEGAAAPTVVPVAPGDTVPEATRALNAQDDVRYAVPNVIAHASGFIPDDPGRGGRRTGSASSGTSSAPSGSTRPTRGQPDRRPQPGGRGVTVAVLDTGVAYRTTKRFRRSPDFVGTRFVRGYDFVDRDAFPDDENGHGTHVAGTIGERDNNGSALTGLAYGATIMPVRVLDEQGPGTRRPSPRASATPPGAARR